MIEASGPNAEMIEYWNQQSGPKWVELEDLLDAQLTGLGLDLIERAKLASGERALDVGCGCGQTSLQLAERVGPAGRVVGVDISHVMLERARQRAREADLAQLSFENADAQTHAFEAGSFDVLFSRFGVMFFADPPAAFANLRSALAPGGRMIFVCWQAIDRNPWMLEPVKAIAPHVQLPPPPEPGAPGPFAFADADRVRGILEQAGFSDVAFESLEREVVLGGTADLDGAVEFVLQIGPAGAALREAGEEKRDVAAAAVREALAPWAGEEGVRLPSASWIVTARSPLG